MVSRSKIDACLSTSSVAALSLDGVHADLVVGSADEDILKAPLPAPQALGVSEHLLGLAVVLEAAEVSEEEASAVAAAGLAVIEEVSVVGLVALEEEEAAAAVMVAEAA